MEQQNQRKRRRPSSVCALSYFEAPELRKNEDGVEKLIYKCKECKKNTNGTKLSNLVVHLKHHKEIYSVIFNDESIEKKRLKLLLDCVEFVAVDGNPFSRLNGTGLLSMLEKTLAELIQAGRGVNLTDPHLYEVKEMLHQTATNVRHKISQELKDRPFSLMVDITTKRRRSILGISSQFILKGKHVIRSLGMLELDESHTGQYLAKVICSLLLEYGVKLQQVIAITTDNGANVVKMVQDVTTQMVSIERTHQTSSRLECEKDVDSYDAEIEIYLRNVPDYTDDQALDILFEDVDSEDEIDDDVFAENEALLNAMVSSLQNPNDCNFTGLVKGVRCGVHTLQLGIHDGLSKLSRANQNVISLCRRIAKTLRLKSIDHELKLAGIKLSVPQLDVPTRWCSSFLMVNIYIIFFSVTG